MQITLKMKSLLHYWVCCQSILVQSGSCALYTYKCLQNLVIFVNILKHYFMRKSLESLVFWKKINVWILYKIWSFRTIAEFLLTAYKRVNLTVHSVNLQKRWTLFEECWHVCVKVYRILIHLESFSSLILPKWFEISKYYKNSIQNFTVDMNLFIPCYPTRKGIDFHLIPQSVEWIKFVENHLCSVQAVSPEKSSFQDIIDSKTLSVPFYYWKLNHRIV